MKYSCSKCNDKGVITYIETKDRFISEDGRILCKDCSVGEVEAGKDFLGKLEIAQEVREKLGINIIDNPENVENLKVESDENELNYYFTYKGTKYNACYLKNLQEVELSILNF